MSGLYNQLQKIQRSMLEQSVQDDLTSVAQNATQLTSVRNGVLAETDMEFKGVNISSIISGDFQTQRYSDLLTYFKGLSGNAVAIVCTWYQDTVTSTNIYRDATKTVPDADVIQAIRTAKAKGYKVMLKPHVDVQDGSWRGDINPSSNWSAWFTSYQAFINTYATIAKNEGVDLFCVGTELRDTSTQTSNWQTVISGVKAIYTGKLTYAANAGYGDGVNGMDEFTYVQFWNSLDYAGIDCYFPMTSQNDPTIEQLNYAWTANNNSKNPLQTLINWQSTINKPVIFTEVGLPSIQGANKNPTGTSSGTTDYQEQANYIESMLQVFQANTDWFHGFFWWRLAFNSSDIWTFENKTGATSMQKYLSVANEKIVNLSKNTIAGGFPILTQGNTGQIMTAFSSSTQNFGAGWFKISFDQIGTNLMSGYDKYTSTFTIPSSGRYFIGAGIRMTSPATNQRSVAVYVNGAEKRRVVVSSNSIMTGMVAVYLNKGDTVQIWVNTPDSITIENNAQETFFTITN